MTKKRDGFTVLELLLVIVLIGVSSVLFVNNFLNTQKRARDNRRKADLNLIASSLEKYYAEKKNYPCADSTASYPYGRSTNTSLPWIRYLTSTYTNNSGDFVPIDPKNTSARSYYFYVTNCSAIPPCSPPAEAKKFILWATLEDTNDPEIYNKTTAKCKSTYCKSAYGNYCVTSLIPPT